MNRRTSHLLWCLRLICLWCMGMGLGMAHATLASLKLADVVSSNGRGDINLMRGQGNVPVTAAQLEALRLDHTDTTTGSPRNYLTLGVDVNENNKGSETSRAQGITLAQVSLTVTRASGTTVYTEYRTMTRALIAPAGTTARSRYHTLLGEGGSSRITGSNSIQQQFDSTLDIFVPDSLANATAVVLRIRLLDVNKTMGDPESFYDYSGGYEDLALLNQADAYFLNVTLQSSTNFVAEAPIVEAVTGVVSTDVAPVSTTPTGWAYYPSATGWYFAAYEDSYPQQGDYDFNDAVVAYRYKFGLNEQGQVMRVEVESYLVADGAMHTLDWHFKMNIGSNGTVTCTRRLPNDTSASTCVASLNAGALDAQPFPAMANDGAYFGGAAVWSSNTMCGDTMRSGAHASVTLALSTAVAPSSIGAPDPVLAVRETGHTIDTRMRDARGFPYALILPAGWKPSCERTDIGLSYGRLRSFIESGGTRDADWYVHADSRSVFDITNWDWPI